MTFVLGWFAFKTLWIVWAVKLSLREGWGPEKYLKHRADFYFYGSSPLSRRVSSTLKESMPQFLTHSLTDLATVSLDRIQDMLNVILIGLGCNVSPHQRHDHAFAVFRGCG
jgi:hypothetical protein